ncbi:hypothetical protein VZT92_017048 [Zoarces viviparus]|uniref:Uncharacterized protein n=1 Tax=Zoarces viviparus TaxID=48416 RepID=A0AAW1ER53_ZOAVI
MRSGQPQPERHKRPGKARRRDRRAPKYEGRPEERAEDLTDLETEDGLFRQNKRKEGWRQMENGATGVSALVKVPGLPPPSRSTQVCGSPAPSLAMHLGPNGEKASR